MEILNNVFFILLFLADDSSYNTTNINLVGLAQTGIECIPIT